MSGSHLGGKSVSIDWMDVLLPLPTGLSGSVKLSVRHTPPPRGIGKYCEPQNRRRVTLRPVQIVA